MSSNDPRERDNVTSIYKDTNVTPIDEKSRFGLKVDNPFKSKVQEKVKLFTKQEAEDEKERMVFIYTQGSGLIDNVLEIIVKGHEKVQIWQLDAEQAEMLATMHLEKAKKDVTSARSARLLLSIYDRLFTIMLIAPRVMRTGQYVKEQGGLSFK